MHNSSFSTIEAIPEISNDPETLLLAQAEEAG